MEQYPFARDAAAFPFEKIRYDKREWRATVTINRPEVLNALDFQTLRELAAAFEDASWDDHVAVLVLTGAGDRAFCTGADVKEQERCFLDRPQDYWKWMGAFIDAHDRLRNIGKPAIARLNGMVVGGGNELNMACDLAIAADHVIIRQVGPMRGSVPAGGATQWLPILVGDRRAREILMLCEEIPAARALEWGLVNQVVPAADLDAAVDTMAGKLVNRLPEILRYTKQQLNFWRDLSWSLTIGHARDWLTLHAGSAETREGLRAFAERRPVDYIGLRQAMADTGAERTCPNCGATDVPARHAFCGVCGAKLVG
ncbi:MAG: enoyl-CoA hydratase/isomerase family protein [Chloroflexi bacterium]|nr:enoyl-CoA hydratase/isomerase family protein [Chloroflexota bacterium]